LLFRKDLRWAPGIHEIREFDENSCTLQIRLCQVTFTTFFRRPAFLKLVLYTYAVNNMKNELSLFCSQTFIFFLFRFHVLSLTKHPEDNTIRVRSVQNPKYVLIVQVSKSSNRKDPMNEKSGSLGPLGL
jgi:hypothetical protein